MAEYVTRFVRGSRRDVGQLTAYTDRLGRGSQRDSDALFELLAAAKGRFGLAKVTQHLCRHDEGEGLCTPDREA